MGEMNIEKRIEMLTKIRQLRSIGQPENAADLQEALDNGEFRLEGKFGDKPKVELKEPRKTASKEAWGKFAREVSDIDEEIIDNLPRNDLVAMLRANGLLNEKSS